MAITFVSGGNWSYPIAAPASYQDDDIIILLANTNANYDFGDWTHINTANTVSSMISAWWRRASGTINSDSVLGVGGAMFAFRGCVVGESPVIVVGADSIGTTSTPNVPITGVDTTAIDNALVVTAAHMFHYLNSDFTFAYSSGPCPTEAMAFDAVGDDGKGNYWTNSFGVFYGIKAAYGATGTQNFSTNYNVADYSGFQFALKPATTGETSPYSRTITESATATDSVDANLRSSNSLTETGTAADGTGANLRSSNAISEVVTPNIGDPIEYTYFPTGGETSPYSRTLSESATISDSVGNSYKYVANTQEASSPGIGVATGLVTAANISESETASIAVAPLVIFGGVVSEAVTTDTSVANTVRINNTLAESVQSSDVVRPSGSSAVLTPEEGAHVSLPVSVTGTGTPGATIELWDLALFEKSILEEATPSDLVQTSRVFAESFVESVTAQEEVVANLGRVYDEVIEESVTTRDLVRIPSSAIYNDSITEEVIAVTIATRDDLPTLTIAAENPTDGFIRIYGTKAPGSTVGLYQR